MGALLLVGRLVFGGFFLYSGFNHFLHAKDMAAYAAQHGVPGVMVAVTGAMLIIGGLHVLLGMMPRFGLLLILAFLIPTSIIMHPFWADVDPQARVNDLVNFTKNLGLIGGALGFLAVAVPWPYSLDEALERRAYPGRPVPH